jgi:hypothetical protein
MCVKESTEISGRAVSTPALKAGGPAFKSRSGGKLFVIFLSFSHKDDGVASELGHSHFLRVIFNTFSINTRNLITRRNID